MKNNNNKMETISFRLTEEEKDRLVQYCQENDMSMSQTVRKAVKEFMVRENI